MSALLLDYSSLPKMHLQEAQIMIIGVISIVPYLTDKGEHTCFTRSTTTTKPHKNIKIKTKEEGKKTELGIQIVVLFVGESS